MSMRVVYIVGSDEDKFICDRVYANKEDAVFYCNIRNKDGGVPWIVMEAEVGIDWMFWKRVYPEGR